MPSITIQVDEVLKVRMTKLLPYGEQRRLVTFAIEDLLAEIEQDKTARVSIENFRLVLSRKAPREATNTAMMQALESVEKDVRNPQT